MTKADVKDVKHIHSTKVIQAASSGIISILVDLQSDNPMICLLLHSCKLQQQGNFSEWRASLALLAVLEYKSLHYMCLCCSANFEAIFDLGLISKSRPSR